VDTEIDLTTATRDVLIAIIAQLQATVLEQQRVIERLQRRIAELAGQAKPDGLPRMPGLKAKSARKPPAQQQPRKQRRHGFARRRMTPTHRVEHVVESCPDCGTHLTGGWVQRTREVIELPVVPVQVTEHVYIARTCPACRRRCTPPAVLDGVVLGQQRLGVNLLSLIATLREEGRLPIRSVQWYLDTVHQLRLSVGAIVSAIHQTAQQAQPAVAGMVDRIRASPVVHADETGVNSDGTVVVTDPRDGREHSYKLPGLQDLGKILKMRFTAG
jgi:transposase